MPSNIAEGAERQSAKEAAHFFSIAKGSLGELQTQLEIGVEVGMLPAAEIETMIEEALHLGRMLGALIARA